MMTGNSKFPTGDKSDLAAAKQNIATGWQQHLDDIEKAKKAESEIIASIKADGLAAVTEFVSVKDGGKLAVTEEKAAYFRGLFASELEGMLSEARDEALAVIKLTEKERYIHQHAQESYDAAIAKYDNAAAASKVLLRWTQKTDVAFFADLVKITPAETEVIS